MRQVHHALVWWLLTPRSRLLQLSFILADQHGRLQEAFMPEFELLVSLYTGTTIERWQRWSGSSRRRCCSTDCCHQLDGCTPLLKALAAKVALPLELSIWDCLFTEHVRSELNVEAYKLSRLWDDVTVSQVVPDTLQNAMRICAPPRDSAYMIAWPKD